MAEYEYIGKMVSREIKAYVAEIDAGPGYSQKDGYWWLLVDVIWNDNGCPMRQNMRPLTFKTEEEAKNVKIGDCVGSKKEFSWLK